ncbi:MAG: hypothetical protein ACXV3D_07550 [Halobacteriota archaeon]
MKLAVERMATGVTPLLTGLMAFGVPPGLTSMGTVRRPLSEVHEGDEYGYDAARLNLRSTKTPSGVIRAVTLRPSDVPPRVSHDKSG